jgi:glutamate/tyrosine decarboxylase-like PLP-dependent enzyme
MENVFLECHIYSTDAPGGIHSSIQHPASNIQHLTPFFMSTDNKLQLSRDEMRRLGYRIVDRIIEHFETVHEKPVTRLSPRAELEARLREPIPEGPTAVDALFDQLEHDVWSNIGHLNHPRFFAFIPGPNNFVSVMADALAAGFNPFAGTWLAGSGPAQVELITIDWLREICGLPETASGLFVSGGSVANLTALAVACHIKLDGQLENAVLYCSDQTHSSIERAVRMLGFTRTQLTKLGSDGSFRLPLKSLEEAFALDRMKGKRPFCVIANAGTTNTGAIDPLNELADFCAAQNLWLHVDGAYGAAAALSERGRRLLDGMGRADSVSLDPHKWLFQPFEIGCVIVRESRMLKKTFHILADYLEDTQRVEEEVNFCERGIQLTRSFRALKLWFSFKVFGAAAFRAAVERGIELAEFAESQLRQSSCWEVVSPATLGVIAFRFIPQGASEAEINVINQKLISAIREDGFAYLSSTILNGRTVLRLCTINPRTTEGDIRATIQRIEKLGNYERGQSKT